MNTRTFGILKVQHGLWLAPYIFFTPFSRFGAKIDPCIVSYCSHNPDYDLDDFLYDHMDEPRFDANWIVAYYGEGSPLEAPNFDVKVISEAYAYGSRELIQSIEGFIKEIKTGKAVIVNPYYDPSEEDEEDDE